MPELPEVEVFRREAAKSAVGQRVESVEIRKSRLLRGPSADTFAVRVTGLKISGAERHGKYLFLPTAESGAIVLHFGLSGDLHFADLDSALNPEDRIAFHLERTKMIVANRRMIGGVSLVPNVAAFIAEKSLGPDAADIPRDDFRRRILSRRGDIKAALMDQSLMAGMGNVYVDELLFQCGIHPRTPADDLDGATVDSMHGIMLRIINTAVATIEKKGDRSQLPATYIIPQRSANGRCPRCRGELRHMSVNGRTTYFCPVDQPLRRARVETGNSGRRRT